MNYAKIYNSLIERAKSRELNCYYEVHHIVPKCMGGSDDKENLANLTPEEHYIAHQLLAKMYPNEPKLIRACIMMIPNRPANKLYGWIKRKFAEAQSINQAGEKNSQFGTIWISNGLEEKKIKASDQIPEGWTKQRLFTLRKVATKKEKVIKLLVLEEQELKNKQIENKVKELNTLYDLYKVEGFEAVKKTGYKYSKPNLVTQFAKYLPDFIPQNGKKRKQKYSS